MSTLSPEPEPAERRAVDNPATLAIAARIVRVALARQAPVARLTPVEGSRHAGGAITFLVTVDGRRIGLVGDGREWKGTGYGTRHWWACHREDDDTAARWSPGLAFRTRTAALAALLAQDAR
jgi:hypothetical protein